MKTKAIVRAKGILRAFIAVSGLTAALPVTSQQRIPPWPYPRDMDALRASPRNEKLLFESNKVRFVEVTILPGETKAMGGNPYPSVTAFDAPQPDTVDVKLDPQSPLNGQADRKGPPPKGKEFPSCTASDPRAPYSVTNRGDFPAHFYRLDFKRLDGMDLLKNWRTWYPWMLNPLPPVPNIRPEDQAGPPVSPEFPFPMSFDSVSAAPNNHYPRYEDDHVRLLEVALRPGERENLHGHPYPSVFANDVDTTATPRPPGSPVGYPPTTELSGLEGPGLGYLGQAGDYRLVKDSVMNTGGSSPPPAQGPNVPRCTAADPQAPHAGTHGFEPPIHFMRIEFKRIDGHAYRTRWR